MVYTLGSVPSSNKPTPFLVSLPCFSLPPYNEQLSKTFRGCVTAVRTLRYGCRKVKIGSVPGHGDMLDWIKGCFVDSII
ncbi:hypothetical protein KY290_006406 [Solanum tuberosum]|uniref:Uncharacterized protein n=1 Tax=Solanum tuberosum TaxID=4113 RepID=A0ABQ7UNF8_SOLTU|nr:hypothetical protein KY285_018435 [Solanum tuberosum]KAH0721384.1 hypothetical protein KY284_006414 [Solanum tuberosum]KAH0750443.1 hypothetical protein KY290_029675 [Solanum tuberosum]KAH0763414.1 hypothetical protein KY290_019487 [Solanum tuberosum]KAH0779979.1 hypothetical protein KY290_006406 [Solanum tuberosum]